jgi:hypothetical protein
MTEYSAVTELIRQSLKVSYTDALKIVDAYALAALARDLDMFGVDDLKETLLKALDKGNEKG